PTRVFVLPDRGLGIWRIVSGGIELGWRSPVQGPVHPRFVPLAEPSGLGWLDGFDELVARCGLVGNGAPEFAADGRLVHGLHGRIANLPAHGVEVILDDAAGTVTLGGAVDETRFLMHALRMTTAVVVRADRPRVSWSDAVENLSDRPATMQMLYHVNLGPPLLGRGAEVVAAVEEIAPRDSAAAADAVTWNRCATAEAGRAERVHFARIRPGIDGIARASLVSPDGRDAACLSWKADALPCFTLWKNEAGPSDGCVVGLEPGTNYPNPRSFEASQGRVVSLDPHGSVRFDLSIEHLTGEEIASARRESLEATAAAGSPLVHRQPRTGWTAG
ncbi:MAG: DUF4432 family protein, partial [Planctomycetia bacterium]|nr:DUF4432 family protein [Planctomycetia bacterium]